MAYEPCPFGVHVCGINGGETEFVTVANFPRCTPEKFYSARDSLGDLAADDADLVVDLFENGDVLDDFGIRRQDLPRLKALLTTKPST